MTTEHPEIFNRALPGRAELPGSAAELVRTVRQPANLRMALQVWRTAQKEYGALTAELHQAISDVQAGGGEAAANAGPLTKRVAELDRRLRGLAETVQTALAGVLAARPPYIAAVTAALAPHRRQCAQRALVAAAALAQELDRLTEIDDEIAAVGGTPGARLPRQGLRPTLARLRTLAEE
jgi:hypothetical protein